MGPQLTLYVPKRFLRSYPRVNEVYLFELQSAPCTLPSPNKLNGDCYVEFVDHEILNGTTPELRGVGETGHRLTSLVLDDDLRIDSL